MNAAAPDLAWVFVCNQNDSSYIGYLLFFNGKKNYGQLQ